MASSHPLMVIQTIHTIWTKASRGGVNASLRNGTAEALELPALAFPPHDSVFLLHQVVYSEHNRFQHPMEKLEQKVQAGPFWYDCLKFSFSENTLSVTLEWERSEGAPKRSAFPRKGFFLQDQQWGRITYNLRTPREDYWVYQKRVLNVGFFTSFAPNVFLKITPAYIIVDMAKLR